MLGGGINMREVQIYIRKHQKNRNVTLSREAGGCRFSIRFFLGGGVKIFLVVFKVG